MVTARRCSSASAATRRAPSASSWTAVALQHLHAENGLFVVLPGHEIPDVETVVDRHNGYLVVRRNTLDE